MVPLTSLLLPILLAAVLVYVASSLIHMVTPLHKNDVRQLPKEDAVIAALRPLAIPPGDYVVPHVGTHGNLKNPELVDKMNKGPVIFMTVVPNGPPAMAKSLTLWFVYCILVSVFAAYIASRAVGPGTEYLEVFRFAGTTAFSGYALALLQNSIWWQRNWGTTLRGMLDGLIYGLLTAGVFGWLWPR
jgi:hypothetical protein